MSSGFVVLKIACIIAKKMNNVTRFWKLLYTTFQYLISKTEFWPPKISIHASLKSPSFTFDLFDFFHLIEIFLGGT